VGELLSTENNAGMGVVNLFLIKNKNKKQQTNKQNKKPQPHTHLIEYHFISCFQHETLKPIKT